MKEMDFVGHFNKEWEVRLENLSRPPAASGLELRLYYKVEPVLICVAGPVWTTTPVSVTSDKAGKPLIMLCCNGLHEKVGVHNIA